MVVNWIGKRYFIVFNTILLFYQLPIIEEYKVYIVINSPRRLEKFNILSKGSKTCLYLYRSL